MKSPRRLLAAAALIIAAFTTGCQTSALTPTASRSDVQLAAVVLKANPDILGGRFGQESITSLTLAQGGLANQPVFAAVGN